MPNLGTLTTRLDLDNRGLEEGARQSEGTMQRLGKRGRELTSQIAKLGVGLGVAGAALVANLTRKGLGAVDAQIKLARSLQGTANGVRAVQIAADEAGLDGLEQSLTAMNRRLGAVEMSGGPALETLDRLNLSAQELQNLDADERLARIADAIQDTGMSSQESARHLQQLGFTQAEANDFFRQGGDAIRNARAEVDEYGLSLSEVDAAQVEAANDAFSKIGRVIEVIQQRLAVKLAPFLEHISNLINDASKESGGFRDAIDSAIDRGIRIGAKLADVVEGVRRAFLLAGQAAATMALELVRDMLTAGRAIMAGPVQAINALIRTANRVPGVSFDEVEMPDIVGQMDKRIALAQGAVEEGQKAMRETLAKPMPSSGLEKRLEDIRDASRRTAMQVVADREAREGPEAGQAEDEGLAEREAKERESMERRLEAMRESVMEETELLRKKHEEQLEELDHFREMELLGEKEHAELMEELEAKHQDELSRLNKDGEKARHDEIGRFARANQAIRENSLAQETAALRSGLQTMFGDHKQFGEALGNLKRIEAVMSSYAWGASIGGPPAGIAAAGLAGAAQLASMREMSSASFSGGSSQANAGSTQAPVQGGGSQQGGGQPQRTTIIQLEGEGPVPRSQVRQMIDRLNEEEGDGSRFMVRG